jgi:ABC-type multidrug transport system fused ATPase/permease subunit
VSDPSQIQEVPILNWTYQQLGLQSNQDFITLLCVLIILVFAVKSVAYFCSKAYIFRFSYNQKRLLVSRLLKAYLAVPYEFHLSRNTASLIKNTILETNHFTNLCLLPLLDGVANLVVVVSLVLLLAKTDFLLLAMIMAILLPTFLFFVRLSKRFARWGKIFSQSQEGMIRTLNHGLGGLKETRVVGCEPFFEAEIDRQSRDYARAATLFESFQVLPRIMIEAILVIFLMLFVLASQIIFQRNFQDLVSIMGIFAIAAIRLIPSASLFMQSLGKLQKGTHALDMLYLDLKEIDRQNLKNTRSVTHGAQPGALIKAPQGLQSALAFRQQVDLRQITYRYPGITEPAINRLSLSLKKGESIALIGKSGAGKTTLVDIVLGLLIPEAGDICVDGVSIYDNLRAWQNLVGYIPQSIFLMDDTIERNIAFGVPDHLVDRDRLHRAVEAAQLTELVTRLPDGLKTGVGERGVRLSGGQRQRIGIARALYHEREILVLDEATSALDNETEQLVSEAINALAGNKTLIIIAHRLSTVEQCDRIYLMEEGQVVRSGSYKEVVLAQ